MDPIHTSTSAPGGSGQGNGPPPSRWSRFLQRRRYLVDYRLQLSLVGHALVLQTLFMVLFVAGLLAPLVGDIGRQELGALSDASIVLLFLHERLWYLILGSLVLTALLVVRLSHRVAGPMVRVKRILAAIGDGVAPPRLVLRPRDYLQPEVALLNTAVERLAERGARTRGLQQQLLRVLAQAAEVCGDLDAAVQKPLQEAIAALRELQQLPTFESGRPAEPVPAPAATPALETVAR